jgi:hypothetical protein
MLEMILGLVLKAVVAEAGKALVGLLISAIFG